MKDSGRKIQKKEIKTGSMDIGKSRRDLAMVIAEVIDENTIEKFEGMIDDIDEGLDLDTGDIEMARIVYESDNEDEDGNAMSTEIICRDNEDSYTL